MLENTKNGRIVPVMHGENWLQPVDSLPEGKRTTCKMYIAGHSESGHNHVLKSKTAMQVVEKNGERYVLINEVATLFHQKSFDIHESIAVQPGIYKITHKTEYDPFAQVIREVWD